VTQPHDEATSFGPLISAGQRDKVLGYIETGKKEGARVVTGGQKWPKSGGGFWIEPTILADTTLDMKVVQEEVSGGSDSRRHSIPLRPRYPWRLVPCDWPHASTDRTLALCPISSAPCLCPSPLALARPLCGLLRYVGC
jgi:hypothetical protein